MKLIILAMSMLMAMSMMPSFAQAEARVMVQHLTISGEVAAISPTNSYTVAVGVDAATNGFSVTHSEYQSLSLKIVSANTIQGAWDVEAQGVDADGNEYWQGCGTGGLFQYNYSELLVLTLPVNAVFRIKFTADDTYSYDVHICTINRK